MNKISVILPFYNNEDTLHRCVESILDQTYTNFEIIAVSDGSTDGSVQIMNRFAMMDSRIVLIKAEHGGVSRARNIGLGYAGGDFIQFIDADDYIEPDMLEKMLHALLKSHSDMCVCSYFHPSLQNYAGDRVFDFSDNDEVLEYYQYAFATVVPWNKLYRKGVIKAMFNEELSFCEDEIFGLANLFNARKVVCISDKLYHYYVAPPQNGKTSCIGKMLEGHFWESDDSIWFKRADLLETSQQILDKRLAADEADDFAYARIFDFMLWGLAIYCASGCSEDGTSAETARIMRDPRFKKSVEIKERLGVKMLTLSDSELSEKVRSFVRLCYEFRREFGDGGVKYRPYYVYFSLFARFFLRPTGRFIRKSRDSMVKILSDVMTGSTAEAQYANLVYEKYAGIDDDTQTA